MEYQESVAAVRPERGDSTPDEKKERRMTIASFSVPERVESESIDRARERLGSVGVVSYVVELAGSGEPMLDVNDATYVGDSEINAAVDELVAERR